MLQATLTSAQRRRARGGLWAIIGDCNAGGHTILHELVKCESILQHCSFEQPVDDEEGGAESNNTGEDDGVSRLLPPNGSCSVGEEEMG